MNIQQLTQLIKDTAAQKGVQEEIIIEDLIGILKMKYGISIMEKEREFIDEVKMKIITRLYNIENQKVSNNDDLNKEFKLDILESDYLDAAREELQSEGLLKLSKGDLCITKQGVMKFKEFYGEV